MIETDTHKNEAIAWWKTMGDETGQINEWLNKLMDKQQKEFWKLDSTSFLINVVWW